MATSRTPWSWNLPEEFPSQSFHQDQHDASVKDESAHQEGPKPEPEPQSRRHYLPRQCRICLETVEPTFETPTEGIASMLNPKPRVTYTSEDPELGRLMRPCKCKGSQRYVHEGCLAAWRHADPLYGARNYYECPTCKFRYHLQRMKWGHWISSASTQLCLTLAILFATIFVMGFIADPIINLYLHPYDTIFSFPSMGGSGPALHLIDTEAATWTEHLLKGLASLGMLGFVKICFAMSPWHWWNVRQTGVFGGRGARAGTGRNRLENISWTLVIIGVGAFLIAVWKWTRNWSRSVLEKAGENVIDVGGDDADEEEDTERNN
ncbi:hypothetical protein DSL72_002680 [Monilinia vaccinii-corymbosi]|uniref:RING-CH-type domain-containing protein n=1 Tax=Monilinia vaccinii-corymbosi TaxID=61207 RepID=A0A8A3PDD2_9HELO|nr:hypothetical protein DSL72_002680 [Monilinia vaccinii-corymbosi]